MSAATSCVRDEDRALSVLFELLRERSGLLALARRLDTPLGGRAWARVFDSSDADGWLIAWEPSSRVGSHDHGDSRGVVHVLRGVLVETYSSIATQGRKHVRRIARGTTVSIPPYRVHDVANGAATRALSLHVYAPRLTTMTFYPPSQAEGARVREERI